MTKEDKKAMVSELKDLFSDVSIAVMSEFKGVTVAEITTLRREIRSSNCEFRVVKNSLATLAAKGTQLEGLSDLFKGSIVLTIGYDDPTVPTKILKKYSDELGGKLKIVCGVAEGSFLERSDILALAALPGKDELMSQMVTRLKSPISGFYQSTSGVLRKLVYVLNAVKEQKS